MRVTCGVQPHLSSVSAKVQKALALVEVPASCVLGAVLEEMDFLADGDVLRDAPVDVCACCRAIASCACDIVVESSLFDCVAECKLL